MILGKIKEMFSSKIMNLHQMDLLAEVLYRKALKEDWSKAVNNLDNKPKKDPVYGNKIRGNIFSIHYMLYNVLRGYDLAAGFNQESPGYKDTLLLFKRFLKFRELELLFPFSQLVTKSELKEIIKNSYPELQ